MATQQRQILSGVSWPFSHVQPVLEQSFSTLPLLRHGAEDQGYGHLADLRCYMHCMHPMCGEWQQAGTPSQCKALGSRAGSHGLVEVPMSGSPDLLYKVHVMADEMI